MNMSEENRVIAPRARPERLYSLLIALAAAVLAATVAVVYNNSVRSAPLYLFLLFLGLGMVLGLGLLRGGLLGLLFISVWITLKQVTGVWAEDRLLYSLLEMILVAIAYIAGGLTHDRLGAFMKTYTDNQTQLKKLDLDDKSIGLLKASIGLLRLGEEEERSVRYKRPFSLVLMQVQPVPGLEWEAKDFTGIMRAVAASVKDTTRDVDIPFLRAPDRIALILPETETGGANKVVSNIVRRMLEARFLTQSGEAVFIRDFAQIRFGFATFLGRSEAGINMMEAAERSLHHNQETNAGNLFHNLFIEWATVGESPVQVPVIGGDVQTLAEVPAEAEPWDDEPSSGKAEPKETDTKMLVARLIKRLRSP
jgi:hypothetical protein